MKSDVKSLPDLAARLTLVCLLIALCSSPAPALVAADGSQGQGNQQKTTVSLNGQAVFPSHGTVAGLWSYARSADGPQMLLLGHPATGTGPDYRAVLDLNAGDRIQLALPAPSGPGRLEVRATPLAGYRPDAGKAVVRFSRSDSPGAAFHQFEVASSAVTASSPAAIEPAGLSIEVAAEGGPIALQLDRLVWKTGAAAVPLSLDPVRRPWSLEPTECSPNLRAALVDAMIQWDWRMQDGIGSPKEPRSFAEAIHKRIPQIDQLVGDLRRKKVDLGALAERWTALKARIAAGGQREPLDWERTWTEVHQIRRALVLKNPLFDVGPLLLVKHVPSAMSHQLTQVYGYAARPGGGIFVLDEPGKSMNARSLTEGRFPAGNFMHSDVSFDGKRVYFAFCEAPRSPERWRDPATMDRYYHIYEMPADGSSVKKLTGGSFDHFNPTCFPDGRMMLVSTRRGGYHRCGGGPCYVYTLTLMEPGGSSGAAPEEAIYPVSFHETNEWDPAILNNGRILYTRWDYVDRDAVFYQNLWTVRPDGTDVRIYFGNNTFAPNGVWEACAVPGSDRVVAIAGPHHGMSGGSVILLDTAKGVDGAAPITRLTPDVRFPEAEVPLRHGIALPAPTDFDSDSGRYWNANRADRPAERVNEAPEEELRWGGHCYRSPYPLSEDYWIVSYSFDRLIGEPGPNLPNMFGVYFADRFGNKELIYRDPNISSQWAKPLRARVAPFALRENLPPRRAPREQAGGKGTGTFYLQNVYESWPELPAGDEDRITHLRIVQVLPKTTPNANNPKVGEANASPGKQVLGTVPVEKDGSAYFVAPAKTPILFQALDARGRAVQTMRSLTYLQPGEQASCVGCHEKRTQAFSAGAPGLALNGAPADIKPGPDGSNPMSYPILIQPVLDRLCVSCHNPDKPDGGVLLTAAPENQFSQSYNALVKRVAYTAWGMPNGNLEPLTRPGVFGARASSLVKMLEQGHEGVVLSDDDWERINTWIDSNALFYGSFDPADQARQLRGERIAGPPLE